MERMGRLETAAIALGGLLAIMWATEIADALIFDDLDRFGILPRRLSGLDGVVWAPFLHGGFGHLISNSVPLVVLGAFVMTEGVRRWLAVTAAAIVGGGLLTWLLARSRVHIGASGLVFGYFGYLLARAYVTKNLRSIAIAVVVALAYGGALIFGLVPRSGVSWESHFFGLVAGAIAAFVLPAERTPAAGPA